MIDLAAACSTSWPKAIVRGMADVHEAPSVVERAVFTVDDSQDNRKLYVMEHYATRDHWCLESLFVDAGRWSRLRRDRHWVGIQTNNHSPKEHSHAASSVRNQ